MNPNLYAAVRAGDIGEVLIYKDNVFETTENQESIIHIAAMADQATIVQEILKRYPSLLDTVNRRYETPLHLAAGHVSVVLALISKLQSDRKKKDFIRKLNVDLETALHLAVRNNHINVVSKILATDRFEKQQQNRKGETPGYIAALAGNIDVLDIFFADCKDTDMLGPEEKTVLHAAVISRKPRTIKKILEKRPNLYHAADKNGWTIFHHTAKLDCLRSLDTLISLGNQRACGQIMANIIAKTDVDNKTPLHIAASEGHTDLLMKLMEHCAQAHRAVDNDGRNIMHMAAEQCHKELILSVLNNYPNVVTELFNQQDNDGNTPLHLLVVSGCFIPEIIKNRQVKTTIRNGDNFTARDALYLDKNVIGDQVQIYKMFKNIKVNESESPEEDAHQESAVHESKRRRKNEKFRTIKREMAKQLIAEYRARASTEMIVAALTATVTFTVGFTMPWGYHDEGLAILSKKGTFRMCLIVDTIGLIFSLLSLFLYSITSMLEGHIITSRVISLSRYYNVISLFSILVTFAIGTYTVLSGSLGCIVCGMASLFFPLLIGSLVVVKLQCFASVFKK